LILSAFICVYLRFLFFFGVALLVPNRYLFKFEFPLRHRATPRIDGDLRDWRREHLLPDWSGLDEQARFAELYAGWNESGIFVAARVEGRRGAFQCNPRQFWKGDNLRVMIDTRDTRDIKRASRYCHKFYFLPSGGGAGGRAPVAGSAKIQRATEDAPLAPAGMIQVASERVGSIYTIEGLIPAEALSGFDPLEHPRIGLYVILEDKELGQQYLTIGDDLYWWVDPSTWPTAVLTR
jgi:hypothetical protein